MRNGWKRYLVGLHPHLLAWIWTVLLLVQVGLAFFVFTDPMSVGLMIAGWVVWTVGVVFALVPILALRTRGSVPEGKSYMATTTLVDTGIYALVRHPQGGTAGLLFHVALPLIGQHWLLVILSAVGMALIYLDTFRADEACIEKFGQAYADYMQRVPKVNFFAGIVRLLRRRGSRSPAP